MNAKKRLHTSEEVGSKRVGFSASSCKLEEQNRGLLVLGSLLEVRSG